MIVNILEEVNVMGYYGRCASCSYYEGSRNAFVMGYCNLRQIPVMPNRSAEDCPYYDDDDW